MRSIAGARGFGNPAAWSWSEIERTLSQGRAAVAPHPVPEEAPALGAAQSTSVAPATPFAELHAHSSYHFLDGVSSPEQLVHEAHRLGITHLACLDRDGVYGAARYAAAAAEFAAAHPEAPALGTVFGAELTIAADMTLTVLCRGVEGYRRLSAVITDAQLANEDKSGLTYPSWGDLSDAAGGHWVVVIDAGSLPCAEQLLEAFTPAHCVIQYQHTLSPDDVDINDALHAIAEAHGPQLRAIVSACPRAATPAQARLAGVKAALQQRASLDSARFTGHPLGGSWLRSGAEMLSLAGECTWLREAVATTVDIAQECAFELNLLAPRLPHFPVPSGFDEISWLRHLTYAGATRRYGPRKLEAATSTASGENGGGNHPAWSVIDRELGIIEELGFAGYFLIVHDIVDFCRQNTIYAQGRGSAANSAVCFALGITNVDAVAAKLLFERFLSPERDGPPDIDLDIESGRREEVIQYVYSRYGRRNAAQVANVITYRTRGAIRDAGRALGYDQGQIDAWVQGKTELPPHVAAVAQQLHEHPRHLGIHSGGMIICDRPISQVVSIQWATMEQRSVVQWDKDDCAAVGLVKFDLLGLGMLEALHHAVDNVRQTRGRSIELWQLDPTEPEVYAMLARADAVGVFQVESRAQLNTLPRLRPREFFDLVVQVALIRPGPIQGGSVHPYIRRRNGLEPVTYDHPCTEPALAKTLGIPLFQEQLMQLVVDVAGFSPAEADTLRRAMGSRRSTDRMQRLQRRFRAGAKQRHAISDAVLAKLWNKIMAFASYGFPESHAQSFASLVYYSAWFKHHYPAEFCAALLRAQPMGFYSPQSLIADARRHGVHIAGVDINESDVYATAWIDPEVAAASAGVNEPRGVGGLGRGTAEPLGSVRLGLASIAGISEDIARRIVAARREHGRFGAISDLSRRADLGVAHVEALARAGALDSLGLSRRQAQWAASIAATERIGMLPGTSDIHTPALPGMTTLDLAAADLKFTGMTASDYPTVHLRSMLNSWHRLPCTHGPRAGRPRGGAPVLPADQLAFVETGTRVRVAGVVTHRQRPATAGGIVFFGVEDETGLVNVIVSPGLWKAKKQVAAQAKIVVIRGIVQVVQTTVTITADDIEAVEDSDAVAHYLASNSSGSRDFR